MQRGVLCGRLRMEEMACSKQEIMCIRRAECDRQRVMDGAATEANRVAAIAIFSARRCRQGAYAVQSYMCM